MKNTSWDAGRVLEALDYHKEELVKAVRAKKIGEEHAWPCRRCPSRDLVIEALGHEPPGDDLTNTSTYCVIVQARNIASATGEACPEFNDLKDACNEKRWAYLREWTCLQLGIDPLYTDFLKVKEACDEGM